MAGETEGRYEQKLSRSIGILGNIGMTVSAVTPASSMFIIVPWIIISVGTGALTSMALAAIIGVFMALCWAELAASFPTAGGDYAMVWHAFKGKAKPWGGVASFVTFAMMLASIAFIPAVIALGTADYLKVVWDLDSQIVGAVVVALATLIAVLKVGVNVFVTGIFLAIEILALMVVAVLGFSNWERNPIDFITDPIVGVAAGGTESVGYGAVLALTAVAVFAYNGYSYPVFYAEETRGHSRGIATAILLSLLITVASEIIPLTAVLVGAPSIEALTTSDSPLTYFVQATSNETVNTLISLGIAIAIFNAVIAIILAFGRILFATGRDHAWPGSISDWIRHVHPGTQTPWVATLVVGAVGVVLCLTVDLDTLITLTGASLVLNYAMIAVASLVGRSSGAVGNGHYRMPGWPIPPLIALGALVYITTEQTAIALTVTGLTALISIIYYVVYLLPRRGTAWEMRMPILHDD